MKLLKHLIYLTVLIVCVKGNSQSIISGKTIDNNDKPLSGATLIISRDSSSTILAFGISDGDGNFRIKINEPINSLFIKASFIGFKPLKKKITGVTQPIEIKLQPSSEELKEVLVESRMIEQRGDTLSFSVNAFKGREDRVIADVLKKIPGIDIMPGGEIRYNGKPIQKYYIEGLDLLEGRYNLANENLSADAVSKVQILENHQPIKVLDSLEFSERASLNIKLKKDITVSGTAEIGSGFSPLLWKVKLTPMIFTKKRQAIVTYQSNNTGYDVAREIRDFSFDMFTNRFSIDKTDWLGILEISEPPFSENRWLDNTAHLGSVNYLTKLNKDYEIKTNISYLNDSQKQVGSKRTRFFTPRDTINLLENTNNEFFKNVLQGKITLEKNTDDNYLKNQLEFRGNWNSQRGILIGSGRDVNQSLDNPFKAIRNYFRMLKPIGKQLITFTSNTGYKESNENLIIMPGQFEEVLNNGKPFTQVSQQLELKDLFSDNSAGFTKKVGKFTLSPRLGFAVQEQQLDSDIYRENEIISSESDFRNRLHFFNSEAYLDNSIRFESEDETWNLRLTTPLAFKNFRLNEENSDNDDQLNRLVFEPKIYLRKKLSAFWETSISSGLSYNFGEIERLYRGYILTNYRNMQRYNAPISETENQNYSTSISYRNPIKQLFLNGSYSYNYAKNNLLYSSQIGTNGQNILRAQEYTNHSSSHRIGLDASKYLGKLHSTVKINANYILSTREQLLNDEFTDLQNTSLSGSLSIDSEITSWLTGNYAINASIFKSAFGDSEFQNISSSNQLLNLYFFLKDNQYLNAETEYYRNSISESEDNYFMNLSYQYTFQKPKIDLNISWKNIFNTEEFINISSSEYTYVETAYRLRPSQILASLKFSF